MQRETPVEWHNKLYVIDKYKKIVELPPRFHPPINQCYVRNRGTTFGRMLVPSLALFNWGRHLHIRGLSPFKRSYERNEMPKTQ